MAIQEFKAAHASADTDAEPTSIHHTLGERPNQAARGNHKHIGTVITWNGSTLPVGYLALNGATINYADYPDYFRFMGLTSGSYTLPNVTKLAVRVK